MKKYKELLESLSHDYVLHSLADKDINAHIKDGKVVVHPDDAASTRAHLRKIGHGHLKVTTKGAHQVAEEVEQIDEKSDQAKRNKTMKNVLDASKGAQYKLQGNVVPDRDEKHKTGQAHNKAIGRALRNEEVEELDENLHRVGVWTTEPNHTSYDKRENKRQKMMRVTASSQKEAEQKARAHFENSGYKVHNTQYMGAIKEEVELDEGTFKYHMDKAIAAHDRGDDKNKQMHLNQAKQARYALTNAQITKNKDLLDKYKQMRESLDEVLKGADAGEYVKDFQDSDAPQFKGKSKEKRHQMAIAAYLEAKRKNK